MINFFQPSKIIFGIDTINLLPDTIKKYGKTCLLVTTPNIPPLNTLYAKIIDDLKKENINCLHFDKVEPNPTTEIIEEGFNLIKDKQVDVILAVGGGSTIDTAKVLAITFGLEKIDWDYMFNTFTNPFKTYDKLSEKQLPLISVSTTSGTGSQVTQASVITYGECKNTIFHNSCFSKECIIDPKLMLSLPNKLTASTGFDAFTHAFESYINPKANCFTEMFSEKAMEIIIENLPKVLKENKIEYREKLAFADTLAGNALANAGACIPHPLSEIIGGITNISHGEALAVVFPAFIEHSYDKNIEKFAKVYKMLCKDTKLSKEEMAKNLSIELKNFIENIGLKTNLSDFNISDNDLNKILNSPILDFLPFAPKNELIDILKKSC